MVKIVSFLFLLVTLALSANFEELKWPKGETFLTFLGKNALPSSIYYSLDKEEQELAAEIVAGVKYQVLKNDSQELEQILIPIGEELQMHLYKKGDKFVMEIIPIIFQEETLSLAVDIQSSPYVDILRATNNYVLANEFVQSFRGGVNFRNLQKGDKLVLFYKQRVRLGKQYGSMKIDVSMVETARKKNYIFFYKENYYDQNGKELENFLLGSPVTYTRVSSEFTTKRFHPILHTYRAHLGIDYAANVGTPVRSAGNGRVSFVGDKGGYGKTITINHDSNYKTLYAHLNGFAKSLRNGQNVRKGDLIGYVGNTGLSSGPHLHFGLYRSEVAINPGSVVKIEKNALGGKAMKDFIDYTNGLKQKVDMALKGTMSPKKEENFSYVHLLEKPYM